MRGGGGVMQSDDFKNWLKSLTSVVRSKLYTAFNVDETMQGPNVLFETMAGNSSVTRFNTSAAANSITDNDIKKLLNDYKPPTYEPTNYN